MEIIQCVPHLARYDAVGNDIVLISRSLQEGGHHSLIYAPSIDKAVSDIQSLDKGAFLKSLNDPNVIVFYHHCVFWPYLDEVLDKIKCKFVVRYHNITPASFYEPYDPIATHATRQGIQQTQRLVGHKNVTTFLSASNYNAQELLKIGLEPQKSQVLPPFLPFDQFKNAPFSKEILVKMEEREVNILFVGRAVPNKGHLHLLKTLNEYVNRYSKDVRLWVVGSMSAQYNTYYKNLESFINKSLLGNYVNFLPSAPFEVIHTLYSKSQYFLLLSEHEGFCVPIVEAQLHDLPIIAVDTTAIKETLGSEQLIFPNFDYEMLAASIAYLQENPGIREALVEAGRNNLSRFHPNLLKGKLDEFIRSLAQES